MPTSIGDLPSENRIHIGLDVSNGEHLYLPLASFDQHCKIRGMTGAMKSVWATYIMLQIVATQQSSLLFVDFGGDRSTFYALSKLCESLSRPFKFVSTRQLDAWHSFSPLQSLYPLSSENVILAANYIVVALSLHHGEGFSKSYFGDISAATILDGLLLCIEDSLTHPTIDDIADRLQKLSRHYRSSDVAHASMALRQLQFYPQLRDLPGTSKIDMPQALADGEVIHAFLPGILEPAAVKIGGMLAWAAITAAIKRIEDGKAAKEIFLVIDEFAVVAQSQAFQQMLILARKFNIRLIFLYQSEESLSGDANARDLRPIIDDNTGVKLLLTLKRRDIEDLQDMSSRVPRVKDSGVSKSGHTLSTQSRIEEGPFIEYNDALNVSGTKGDGYLIHSPGTGHVDPIHIRFAPIYFQNLIAKDVHAAASTMALPQRQVPVRPADKSSPDRERRIAALNALLGVLRREENAA